MSKKTNKQPRKVSEKRPKKIEANRVIPDKPYHGPCYASHPCLEIVPGVAVYGGSASNPVRDDCDIYVSLDSYTHSDKRQYPWNPGEFIHYPVTDMQAPKNPPEFRKLVKWLAFQIGMGQSVHVGCFSGHGRTGMLLAALVKELTGRTDAIQWVRDHYCHKVVETMAQINFLKNHFGIDPVMPSKEKTITEINSSLDWLGGHGYGSIAQHFNETYVTPTLKKK